MGIDIDRQVAPGFNNAAGLESISDGQGISTTNGPRYARYKTPANGFAKVDGKLYEVLEFRNQTEAEYLALLAAHGYTDDYDDISRSVTYRTVLRPNEYTTFTNYNAIVEHLRGEGDAVDDGNGIYSLVRFTYNRMEAL